MFNIEVRYSQGVIKYLDKVKSVVIVLRKFRAIISNEILVIIALQSLNKKFDTLVSIIIYGEQPTFDSLIILLEEEAIRKRMKASKDVIPEENYIAFAAIINTRRKEY